MKTPILLQRQNETIEKINTLIDEVNSKMEKELKSDGDFDLEKYQKLSEKLNALKEEKRHFNLAKKIESVNAQHQAKREFLKDFFTLQLPVEDITNLDGSIHLTKIKKYPELKAFIEKYGIYNVSFSVKANKYASFTGSRRESTHVHGIGEIFVLENGSYPNENSKYLNFDEALRYNDIRATNLSVKQFLKIESKLIAESKKIEKIVESHNNNLRNLGINDLERDGLIGRSHPQRAETVSKKFF